MLNIFNFEISKPNCQNINKAPHYPTPLPRPLFLLPLKMPTLEAVDILSTHVDLKKITKRF